MLHVVDFPVSMQWAAPEVHSVCAALLPEWQALADLLMREPAWRAEAQHIAGCMLQALLYLTDCYAAYVDIFSFNAMELLLRLAVGVQPCCLSGRHWQICWRVSQHGGLRPSTSLAACCKHCWTWPIAMLHVVSPHAQLYQVSRRHAGCSMLMPT